MELPLNVLVVDRQNPQAYQTIQSALNALPATGGVVWIAPGVYTENLVCLKPAVSLLGFGALGPGWVNGVNSQVVIQSEVGTTLQIGNSTAITDPGWTIQGIEFVNTGTSQYGLHIGRMRNLTLRDVQFRNYQNPAGAALYLDGTGGWVEWTHLDNVCFSLCAVNILTFNATDTNLHGGMIENLVPLLAGSIGIHTTGVSDTLRAFGFAIHNCAVGVQLDATAITGLNEMAQLFGLRVESEDGGVGVQVNTSNNVIVGGSFYGLNQGIVLGAKGSGNKVVAPIYSACGTNIVNGNPAGNVLIGT